MSLKFILFISLILFLIDVPRVEGACTTQGCVKKCKGRGYPGGYCTSIPYGVCICGVQVHNLYFPEKF